MITASGRWRSQFPGVGRVSWYLMIPSAVVFALSVAGGIATLRTGWVLPWLRRRMFRPRLWGYGELTMAAGVALCASGGLLEAPQSGTVVSTPAPALALVSLGLVMSARRPGSGVPAEGSGTSH